MLLWKLVLFVGCGVAYAGSACAQAGFPLVVQGGATQIVISPGDAPVVRIAAEAFAEDVSGISGQRPQVIDSVSVHAPTMILAGTIGRNALIDRFRHEGKLGTSAIEGKWESFAIRIISHPTAGIDSALVVVGSDPRGTAYGVLELSRKLGVSPWAWWADVPLPHRRSLTLKDAEMTSGPPSVQYRGIFLNDEDFALRVWAARTQDKELHNIGPKTYGRIFELLLRLRANTLWPAMHPGTRPFNADPQNAALAAKYSIVMGSSHAEPMMRNNVSEWDAKSRGAWDYEANRYGILHYWDERVASNGQYENSYTLGMRGIHDSAMPGTGTPAQKAKVLERVLEDQRKILAKHIAKPLNEIPQVFWMYKEVLDLYHAGMEIPDDVTLGWTDDNYGYIRQLSDSQERKRGGGSGVYYHVSYWGSPQDYLWLCTTPPELMREEMTKAYAYGARKIWILNVGDIKPAEADIDYFLDLAWDEPKTEKLDQHAFLRQWSAAQFPAAQAGAIGDLLDRYYQLNFERKPEFMGFNVDRGAIRRTSYNPLAFGDQNLARRTAWRELVENTAAVERQLPLAFHDAFFELVSYPIEGAAAMNDKMLLQDAAALAAAQGRASATGLSSDAAASYSRIQTLTVQWDEIAGGKWSGMMSASPHDGTAFEPPMKWGGKHSELGDFGVAVEGAAQPVGSTKADAVRLAEDAGWITVPLSDPAALPIFRRNAAGTTHVVDIFSASGTDVHWTATADSPWIRLDKLSGKLHGGQSARLDIHVDWARISSSHVNGSVTVSDGAKSFRIAVEADSQANAKNDFTENEGSVSISPEKTTRRIGDLWRTMPGLSASGEALGVADNMAHQSADPVNLNEASPQLQYSFAIASAVTVPKLEVFTLPTFPSSGERRARYAISVDGDAPTVVDTANASPWSANVLRNSSVSTITLKPMAAGQHTLHFWYVDPGVFAQHFVLHTSPGPQAYPFPPDTDSLP